MEQRRQRWEAVPYSKPPGAEAPGPTLYVIRNWYLGTALGQWEGRSLGEALAGAVSGGASLAGADLRGSHLAGADLAGAELSLANLRGACLRGARFTGARLSSANLAGADLRGASFCGADLRAANLRGASLGQADFLGCDLTAVRLAAMDPISKPWARWLQEDVPHLLLANGADARDVMGEDAWSCHDREAGPLARAFGSCNLERIPEPLRGLAERFLRLFDLRLIPRPTSAGQAPPAEPRGRKISAAEHPRGGRRRESKLGAANHNHNHKELERGQP